jgi:hypothetical protein
MFKLWIKSMDLYFNFQLIIKQQVPLNLLLQDQNLILNINLIFIKHY